MKKTGKILLSLLILLILIITEEINYGLGIKTWVKYQLTHTKNIDTSFFTDEMKKNIVEVINKLDSKNSDYIEITNNNITYYDSKNNLLGSDNLGQDIKELLQKNNINLINIDYKNKKFNSLSMSFIDKEYTFVYETNKHNYKEGYVIPVLAGRVEKVIDDYWYISRMCDRTICQEPQG